MQRISYIDVAKGILITLVVLGHCAASSLGDHSRLFFFIYAFHMPCWFFLSGMFYRQKTPKEYFFAKTKTLFVPYLTFNIINLLLFASLKVIHKEQLYSLTKFGGLWFVITLYTISISYFIIEASCLRKFPDIYKKALMTVIAIVFLLSGFAMGSTKLGVHDTICATMVNFFFFHIGYCVQDVNKHLQTTQYRYLMTYLILGVTCLFILFIFASLNSMPVDVNINRFGNHILFICHALLGITGIMLFSAGIQRNRFIEYLGRNSLLILLIHIPLWRISNKILLSYSITGYHQLCIIFTISLSLSLLILYFVNRYIPELKGEFKYD